MGTLISNTCDEWEMLTLSKSTVVNQAGQSVEPEAARVTYTSLILTMV